MHKVKIMARKGRIVRSLAALSTSTSSLATKKAWRIYGNHSCQTWLLLLQNLHQLRLLSEEVEAAAWEQGEMEGVGAGAGMNLAPRRIGE